MAVTTLGAFPGANNKDVSARIPAAISALNKALAGDMQALAYMRGQAQNSATVVGKDAFNRALAIYDAQKPAAAPSSTDTTLPHLVQMPRPEPIIVPRWPLSPPDRRVGWRLDPDNGWVFFDPSTVSVLPGITLPIGQPKPVGFQPAPHPVFVPGGVTVTGSKPGQVPSVNVGSPDGGVITGSPAPEFSGPASAPLAPANFGYVAPTAGTPEAQAPEPGAPAPSNNKILLVLAAGVVLWMLVEGKRK